MQTSRKGREGNRKKYRRARDKGGKLKNEGKGRKGKKRTRWKT